MKALDACVVLLALTATQCSRSEPGPTGKRDAETHAAPAASAPHEDEPAHGALPKRVRLAPPVIAAARIRTAPVARGILAATIDLPGEITSDPNKTARISALVAGHLESVTFQEGQSVKKG